MPSKTQIAEWRALADAASPEPWEVATVGSGVYEPIEGNTVADTFDSEEPAERIEANEAFIAASRTAVPAMADMIDRLADALAMAESQTDVCVWCSAFGDHMPDCELALLLAEYNA